MMSIEDILQEMADQMKGVMILSVVGIDGFTISEHNPAVIDSEGVSARFAYFMNSIEKSINEIDKLGNFEENLVLIQTEKSWVLTRLLAGQYFLNIVVSREETLKNVRLVAQKYSGKLDEALSSI